MNHSQYSKRDNNRQTSTNNTATTSASGQFICNRHWQEWVESQISDDLIKANLRTIPPNDLWESGEFSEVFDYLFPDGEEALKRRNDGRLSSSSLRKIDQPYLNDGGWLAQGFDIETGQRDWFITYKPDSPRWDDEKGKAVKYEHPRNRHTKPFYPAIPHSEANTIAFRAGADTFSKWEQFRDSYQGDPDFAIWQFAKTDSNITIHITEGYKKTASLITQGRLTIGLSGIWNWIDQDAKTFFDYKGKKKRCKTLSRLIKPLLGSRREVCIWFDEDKKAKTRLDIYLSTKALGKAISKAGSKVSVVTWNPEDGKGIDDAIALNGEQWLEQVYQNRLSLSGWLYFYSQWLNADKILHKPFLTKGDINSLVKLVGIKSEKGTGKTEALAAYIQDYIQAGIPVLVLSHRVQLVRALSDRFGIDNAYNFRTSDTKGALGLALCVDSLHQQGQANFNPENWDDFVLIVDEVEQVVNHTLLSDKTAVKDHRVEVLENLSTLTKNARQVILSDADLSNRSLDYFTSLIGSCSREVIHNTYLPAWGRKLFNYNSPESLLNRLIMECEDLSLAQKEGNTAGKNILIATDSQQASSTWSAQNLKILINQKFPNLKVGIIDSETVGDCEEECYHATEKINQLASEYNVLIYTSVVGTGVSIDLKGHFGSVYSWNQGNQSENSTRQFLGRLREGVPRHCYFKPIGNNKLGNGESEAYQVKSSNKKVFKQNRDNLYKLNQESLKMEGMEDHVNAYCRYVAIHNLGLSSYQEIVLEGLKREGYNIQQMPDLEDEERKELRDLVNSIRDGNYDRLTSAIAQTETPTDPELTALESKQELTKDQRHKLRKGKMEKLYGVEADQELIEQDDDGLYPQLSLQFWLTVGRSSVADCDNHKAKKYQEQHGKKCYSPDFNRTQNTAKVQVLEILKIPDVLALEGQKLHNDCEAVKQWWKHIEYLMLEHYDTQKSVKDFLGLTLSEQETPMRNLGKFLNRIGYQLTATGEQTTRSETSDKKRHHIYRLEKKCSKQDEIFSHWRALLDKDSLGLDDSQLALLNYFNDDSISIKDKSERFYELLTDSWESLKAIAFYIKDETLVDDYFSLFFDEEVEKAAHESIH